MKQRMKRAVIAVLLEILNSRWLNGTPCSYAFVGNIDDFSRRNLESSDIQQPGITVREVLDIADKFKMCPLKKHGMTVIEDGEYREGTVWDIRLQGN